MIARLFFSVYCNALESRRPRLMDWRLPRTSEASKESPPCENRYGKINSTKGTSMRRITIVVVCAMIAPLAFAQPVAYTSVVDHSGITQTATTQMHLETHWRKERVPQAERNDFFRRDLSEGGGPALPLRAPGYPLGRPSCRPRTRAVRPCNGLQSVALAAPYLGKRPGSAGTVDGMLTFSGRLGIGTGRCVAVRLDCTVRQTATVRPVRTGSRVRVRARARHPQSERSSNANHPNIVTNLSQSCYAE